MDTPLTLLIQFRTQHGPHPTLNKAIELLTDQDTARAKQRLLQMVTPEGFKDLFYKTLHQQQCTHAQAFEILNEEYFNYTGKYRYKNFASFKALKDK